LLLGLHDRERHVVLAPVLAGVDDHGRAGGQLLAQDEVRERVLDVALDRAAKRTGAHGLSVWLNLPFAAIASRIGGRGKTDRPLFKDGSQALALYRERLPVYRRSDLTVDIAPDEGPEEIAARIALLIGNR
ncbi:MAG TPA: shikimate kinase, partial [Thermoanaerobaculia bacterium]